MPQLTKYLPPLQGGHTVDYVGALRVFGIADKLIFEQLTQRDNQEMTM